MFCQATFSREVTLICQFIEWLNVASILWWAEAQNTLLTELPSFLTAKEVTSFCLHLRVLPRPTAGTVLREHAAEGLLLMLPLLVPEPWKARLDAADMLHQLLLWLDVQLDVSKQLPLPTAHFLCLFSHCSAQPSASSSFPFLWQK